MKGVLRRQELQEAEEERELRGLQPKPQTTRRYEPIREATLSDHDSESGSDNESNQQAHGLYKNSRGQVVNSASSKFGMSFLR
jgi:hypothetical protein